MAACRVCGSALECPACRDQRDRHTDALQRRFVGLMARSTWPTITLTPIELAYAVALIGDGWTLADAIDRIQAQRGQAPFTPIHPEAA
jgi:hypothetical protein